MEIQKKHFAAGGAMLRKNAMLIALIACTIAFEFATNGIFFSGRNVSNILRQTSIIGVVTMSMLMLIISGNIDLAVGMSVAASGGIAAVIMVWWDGPTVIAILASITLGTIIGVWQGLWITKGGLNAFICTLADLLLFKGIYLLITQGKTVGPVSNSFKTLGQAYLPIGITWAIGIGSVAAVIILLIVKRKKQLHYNLPVESLWMMIFRMLAYSGGIILIFSKMCDYNGMPVPVLILFSVIVITAIILQQTRFGRRIYAIGGNREAAKLSGVNINRHILMLYIMAGVYAAIAGCMLVARLDGAVSSAGFQYETDCISACVIGGASLSGGMGTAFGAVIGALLISVLANGMGLLNISTYVQYVVKGLVLILAVWFDIYSRRKK